MMVPIVCTEAERERNGIWEQDHMYGEGTTSDITPPSKERGSRDDRMR